MESAASWADTRGVQVVDWARVEIAPDVFDQWFSGTVRGIHDAGGARTLDQDRAVSKNLAGQAERDSVASVRAWEPPMAEFVDFVAGLRRELGADRDIAVVPVGVSDDHRPLPQELAMWRRRLDALGDPWLRVISVEATT